MVNPLTEAAYCTSIFSEPRDSILSLQPLVSHARLIAIKSASRAPDFSHWDCLSQPARQPPSKGCIGDDAAFGVSSWFPAALLILRFSLACAGWDTESVTDVHDEYKSALEPVTASGVAIRPIRWFGCNCMLQSCPEITMMSRVRHAHLLCTSLQLYPWMQRGTARRHAAGHSTIAAFQLNLFRPRKARHRADAPQLCKGETGSFLSFASPLIFARYTNSITQIASLLHLDLSVLFPT